MRLLLNAAADCYTTRCYCCIVLAALLVATAYCLLLYACMRYGLLPLAMHIPERLAGTCYLLWSFLTKCKTCQEA